MPNVLATHQLEGSQQVTFFISTFFYFLFSLNRLIFDFTRVVNVSRTGSQELLDAIEQEKSFRANARRNTTIFHHPTLGDFELQHVRNLLILDFLMSILDTR